MKYRRVLLKLSGEALMGEQQYGIDPERLNDYAEEIAEAAKQAQIAIVIGGGSGNPFFTTDTASALRAVEVRADIILKGTRVDGIYTADPEKDPTSTKFEHITYDEAYNKNLKVMDLTAFTLCKENNMPMYVFDMNTKGNLLKVLNGEEIGTLVTK